MLRSRRRTWGRLVACALLLLLVVPAAVSARPHQPAVRKPVPPGFVGMVVDGPLYPITQPPLDMATQLDSMVAAGVETMRATFDWASAQPYQNFGQVPKDELSKYIDVGGVPTDFNQLDQLVSLAAQRRMTILPTVLGAPRWDGITDRRSLINRPRRNGPYANFVKALVLRYGPNGSFWRRNHGVPKVPIRQWQIWNEPNIPAFWSAQPYAKTYVSLLKAARSAIKGADHGAKVVLAGFPNYSWVALKRIYAVKGARSLFDVVAVHPYTKLPDGVITILNRVRQTMAAAGDARKPMIADEISWPSSRGQTPHNTGFDFATTPAGQARNIAALLPMLGKDRVKLRLQAFYYYTWIGSEQRNGLAFDFAGLLKLTSGKVSEKPAFKAFRQAALALERCRQRGTVATRCLKPA
jgi:polysaccharide biosynthesis protein PslG